MKKFVKISLITAFSMLAVGIVILGACIIFGGNTLMHLLENDQLSFNLESDLDLELFDHAQIRIRNGKHHTNFSEHHSIHSGAHENKQVALNSEISNLELELGGGNCLITESEDEYFHISSKEHTLEYQYYVDGGTLYIKGFDHSELTLSLHDVTDNIIYLAIPKDFSFTDVDIEIGAGIVEADLLSSTKDFTLTVGAGEFSADSLHADSLTLDLGVGDADIQNAVIRNAEFTIGMGSMDYSGIITGDLDAECGMGTLDMNLNDAEASHNYDIECGIGNVTIGSNHFSSLSHNSHIDHNAQSTYTLECGMGNISLSFQ